MIDCSIKEFLHNALKEDLGRGDLYSRFATPKPIHAKIIAKSSGIFSGELYAKALFEIQNIKLDSMMKDKDSFKVGDEIARFHGENIDILNTERVLLNTISHSSGIATLTNSYIQILKDNNINIKLLDTRKTRPLLRNLEKYSTRNGGATNHRLGLDDMLMLKDTHIADMLSSNISLKDILQNARDAIPLSKKIEMECESVEGAKIAFDLGVDILMCDNMSVEDVREVVNIRNHSFKHIFVESSGNITKDNLLAYATSGVDALSIGSIIHQATWVDLSMKVI